ncbi:MAG: S41 family peptidase [Chloroflexi bacterium]|nr:S41 family peptidase [Chloroflexota bacterium]
MHKYKRTVLVVAVIIFLFSPPVWAGEKPVSLTNLMSIVQKEYVHQIPRATLAGGAISGMQLYLKLRGEDYGFLKEPKLKLTDDNADQILDESYNEVLKHYPTTPEEGLSRAGIRGMMTVLSDPYSFYMTPEQYKDLMEEMQTSSFAGAGILIELDRNRHDQLTVVEPIEGSPADRAGLKAHDMILEIDGKSTQGITLEKAQVLIRGEKGSKVVFKIKRPSAGIIFNVTITRDDIITKAVYSKMIYGVIGYIKLRFFGENTGDELAGAIASLRKQGAQGFILDLRNNGGGYISSAIEVTSQLLSSGSKVVSVEERNAPVEIFVSKPNLNYRYPFVVLMNRNSASASEITAASLQEYGRSKLIGERSYGKASVQRIFPLADKSAVKLTIARYLTPSGAYIHNRGIIPDIPIPDNSHAYGYVSDKVVETAVNELKTEIRSERGKTETLNELVYKIENMKCPGCSENMQILEDRLELKNGEFYENIVYGCPKENVIKHITIKRLELISGNYKIKSSTGVNRQGR